MVGYPESLTDPSYKSQILVLTYPLVGNYGVPAQPLPPDESASEDSLPSLPASPFESNRVHVAGLIVQEHVQLYSHWTAARSLHEWLLAEGVTAIAGIDTRMLTKRIRSKGVMLAKVSSLMRLFNAIF